MSQFTTRTVVRCPLAQAPRRLAQYFRAHGNADGDVVRLKLDVELPRRSASDEIVRVGRNVIATIVPARIANGACAQYDVTWAAQDGGPFPVFVGRLFLEPDEDYESFFLRLTGDYDAPLGAAGAAFDAIVGRRIAKVTIATLLLRIADEIEDHYQRDERAKRRSTAAAAPLPEPLAG